MQNRFHNFQDDDDAFSFNLKFVGLFEPGIYRGFDFVPGPGLTLVLGHDGTGARQVKKDQTTETVGVLFSRQGVVIQETAPIELAIPAGGVSAPRIDLVVCAHEYVEAAGGTQAVYTVIQGEPGAVPVAPALTFPNKQVILGQLYIPAGATNLNGPGVVYTRAVPPPLANNGLPENVALTDRVNRFTKIQQLGAAVGTYADLGGAGTGLVLNGEGNSYTVEPAAAAANRNIRYLTAQADGTEVNLRFVQKSSLSGNLQTSFEWQITDAREGAVVPGYSPVYVPSNTVISTKSADGVMVKFVHLAGLWVYTGSSETSTELLARIGQLEALTAPLLVAGGSMLFWNKPANMIPAGWQEVTNWRGRIPVGHNPDDADFNVVGATGGTKQQALTVANLPEHDHANGTFNRLLRLSGAGTVAGVNAAGKVQVDNAGGVIAKVGGNQPFSLLNPYRVVLFIEYVGTTAGPDPNAIDHYATGYGEGFDDKANGLPAAPRDAANTGYDPADQTTYEAGYSAGYADAQGVQ